MAGCLVHSVPLIRGNILSQRLCKGSVSPPRRPVRCLGVTGARHPEVCFNTIIKKAMVFVRFYKHQFSDVLRRVVRATRHQIDHHRQ